MRSRNMQKLTDQVKARHPGVVIYGIGDAAHQRSPSGHNEDDTAGSRPEQEDPDGKPEHRAIDIMLGPALSRAQAWDLVTALVTHPVNRARLLYVIFDGWSWSASRGWVKRAATGDPHRDHPHVSGTWQDDENTADWVLSMEDDMSQRASQVIEAWAIGAPTDAAGKSVEPVRWRIRDEQWQAGIGAQLAAMRATIEALAAALRAGGGDVETAAVLAKMEQLAADDRARDEAHRAQVAALEEALADRDARLAAALAGQ